MKAQENQKDTQASAKAEAPALAPMSVEAQRDILLKAIGAYAERHKGNEFITADPAYNDMQNAAVLVKAQG